ncbi:unnamed protein product [Microthlaspi erraticum]|uniref:Uncharacterized protein n=1 Tax=Microthlaspi erraticum TaxID=1685480 RepID=A0A6D2JCB4_9BRAS|nr:unnamed protein product [Microthlaspi erraticum]CAA7024064.1 unnamed protein product [Microthlaspi erraticum]CAA7029740.1 unnamed protein product [Microthlaspi erraticum]CAA7037580.1 unnamed protein product [Microthlaspi erraticum]CAA7053523.1 unnamed protein product [Microthlaspi erraticum]
MHKVFGPHCVVNDYMVSASQIDEIVESDNDEEEQESGEDDDDNNEEGFTYGVPESQPQQPMENHSSVPIEIPTHNRRSRQHGNRGGRTTNRGRNQSSRQTTQIPRRRAVMDTHLTNIESYLATMQTPIQMLNARSQANEDYERESWLQLNELQGIEKFTDFWWASSEILRDPFEQKRFVLLKNNEERIRFLEGVTGYDRSGTFRGSPWKRQLSGSSGPSSRGSFGSGSGSPGVGGFSQFNNAGNFNIGGTSNFGGDGTSNLGGFSQFVSSGSPNQFRRRQGFQVPNSNPQFDESSNPRVSSDEGFAYRPASASELLDRFNLSDFNRTIGNNDNDGDN